MRRSLFQHVVSARAAPAVIDLLETRVLMSAPVMESSVALKAAKAAPGQSKEVSIPLAPKKADKAPKAAKGRPPGAGSGGGGGEEAAGNNLSFPVIWSDAARLALRGTYGAPVLQGTYTEVDGVKWYHQQDPLNTWQAQSADWSAADLNVDWVDWGDNLEARDWPARQPVRVETVLYQDLAETAESVLDSRAALMTAFEMKYLSGEGPSEMQGTNGAQPLSSQATVYSGAARLTIQKLSKTRDDPTLSLTWDAVNRKWVGDAANPTFNDLVGGAEGMGGYTAEVNVSGKAIFGYNWRPTEAGDYRLTFSFDAPATNAFFDADTGIPVSEEEGELAAAAEPDMGGGTAHVDPVNNLSFIDVRITAKGGGGGGGGKPATAGPKKAVVTLKDHLIRGAKTDRLFAESDPLKALLA